MYSSVPSQIVTNKENNKKSIEGTHGSKVVLKPREFGREITNAATASSTHQTGVSKNSSSGLAGSNEPTTTTLTVSDARVPATNHSGNG